MRPAHIRNTCILVCAVLSVAACSTTRRLGSDEVLYTGVKKIRIEPDSGVVLSAVGCVYRWELRDASGVDVQSGTEDVEIVSLMGTVSEHGSHLHASLAHRDLSVFGGHLRPGCLVNTTAEIVLAELPDTVFTRERDEATGYEELAIRRIDRQF